MPNQDWRATTRLANLLNGHTPWDEADASVQSWARFYVHQAAVRVCSQEDRQAALASLPDFIRPRVETEARRIWPLIQRKQP